MQETKSSFFKVKKKYLALIKKQENFGEKFYDKIGQLKDFYLPICDLIYKTYLLKNKTIVIGLSGAQGTGKTTVSKILKTILNNKFKVNTVCFSIDDFYKTRKDRKVMSKKKHRLFLTRGVPGTHDTILMRQTLKKLLRRKFKPFYLPKFDKSIDDRMSKKNWKKIVKKPQIVIFEGWCVSAKPQNGIQLLNPVNTLEKKNDKNLIWRKEVNNQLKKNYKSVFRLIDKKIYLKVPNFKHVFKWRLLQEKKLKLKSRGKKIMTKDQVKEFIMYYERITRQMLKDFRKNSDVVLKIDSNHKFTDMKLY
tara:strand:- start:889 stop:1806 length:918 start_codon:yes stop_codon:yes gene_type:complete